MCTSFTDPYCKVIEVASDSYIYPQFVALVNSKMKFEFNSTPRQGRMTMPSVAEGKIVPTNNFGYSILLETINTDILQSTSPENLYKGNLVFWNRQLQHVLNNYYG